MPIQRDPDGTWRARPRFDQDTCDRMDAACEELGYVNPLDLIHDAVEEFLRRHGLD